MRSLTEIEFPLAAEGADSVAIAASLQQALVAAYAEVGQMVGRVGVEALTRRAIQLARREYSWLAPQTREPREAQFAALAASMGSQPPAAARSAAGAVLREFCGLVITFLGPSLAERLLSKAWPTAFPPSRGGAAGDKEAGAHGHQEHKS